MSHSRVITNGKVVTEAGVFQEDIEITEGTIRRISENIPKHPNVEPIDAEGQYVLPGMIDTHVHMNEPGRTEWEGFETGSKALAAGGTTAYIDMPLNALPATSTRQALQQKIEIASTKNYLDYAFYGALTPDNLDHLEELAEAGAVAFKCFLSTYQAEVPGDFQSINDLTLLEGMKRISSLGKILLIHCENAAITDGLALEKIKQGKKSGYDFVESRPIIAEVEAVSRVIHFAKETGCSVHIVHVSSYETVQLIQRAKQEGVDITLESCPHYFALNADDLMRLGSVAKCQPPLRYPEEQEALWQALIIGDIDWISSDHSPCSPELKKGHIFETMGGISGCQNNVDLMFDLAVNKRGMSVIDFAKLIAANPAKRFAIPNKGKIALGYDADLILINPHQNYTLEAKDLYYKNPHSPYIGMEIGARVTKTFLRGELIFSTEQGIIGEPKGRQWCK
ncbi:allantoinase AllB [Gracilibacillus alcaliphilus]|uniref:allantoinase AllB n=1 Tax=Gracilibacillus alcaliphilus TaxID=1401441 RepID=UPI001956D0D4|nr:allantoinase AllB [Gracilibacillus alcaliphilus]MBM7677520.1 allantoinase [Gracilibacillus alcaliphilus]